MRKKLILQESLSVKTFLNKVLHHENTPEENNDNLMKKTLQSVKTKDSEASLICWCERIYIWETGLEWISKVLSFCF